MSGRVGMIQTLYIHLFKRGLGQRATASCLHLDPLAHKDTHHRSIAMAAFLSGGADVCGPSNVLKNVNGRLDRDVSLQQVRLGGRRRRRCRCRCSPRYPGPAPLRLRSRSHSH